MAARTVVRVLLIGWLLTLATIISGGLVSVSGSSTTCLSWPLCLEELRNGQNPLIWISLTHRALVALALLAVVAGMVAVWRRPETTGLPRIFAFAAGFLFILQALAGALLVWGIPAMVADVWHLSGALLAFGAQTLTLLLITLPAQSPSEALPGVSLRPNVVSVVWRGG